MLRVERMAKRGLVAIISMPLLTELVSHEDGFCYRHDAPNGAVPARRRGILSKTAKNRESPTTPLLHHSVAARRPNYGLAGRALISTGLPLPTTTLPEMRELSSGRKPGWAVTNGDAPRSPPAPKLVAR